MKRVTTIDAHVGRRLKLRRINLGLSQQELGNLLKITFQQIQKYEKGINRISSGKLFEFSKALNIPVTYFFEDIEGESSNADEACKTVNYNDLNKEILVISRLLGTVESKDKRKNLINTIKDLIKFIK